MQRVIPCREAARAEGAKQLVLKKLYEENNWRISKIHTHFVMEKNEKVVLKPVFVAPYWRHMENLWAISPLL
jgi:hypothetical protein